MYKSTIQSLTAKVSEATLAAMPPIPLTTATEDADGDKEEEKLHGQLQNVLKSCAESLGINVAQIGQAAATPIADVEEIDGGEEGDKSNKRPRSLEPFGGQPSVGDFRM